MRFFADSGRYTESKSLSGREICPMKKAFLLLCALLLALGSAVFYWCVLARFMENSSSWHRVAPTAMVWQLLAGLMFLSALARALYLPGTSDGRTLCAGGLAAFALCLCWELPTVLQTLVQEGGGALLTPTLLFRLGLCCVGALGALSAVRCTRTEQGA